MPDSKNLSYQTSGEPVASPMQIWLMGLAVYLVLYTLSWLAWQQPPTALVLLPVILTGWLAGWRYGLLAGLLALPLNLLLPLLFDTTMPLNANDGWLYLAAVLIGGGAGQLQTLRQHSARQQAGHLQAAAQWRQERIDMERALVEMQVIRDAVKGELEAAEAELATQREVMASRQEDALLADQLKTELLANVGHELRSPLGAIVGFGEMLHAGYYGPVTRRQQHILQRIIHKAHDMTTLVNDLLDQAHLETGKLTLNSTLVAPATLLAQVDDLLGLKAQKKAVMLVSAIEPDVPPVLLGDPMRLQQILANLVDNAIKFTSPGGEVRVTMHRPEPDAWSMTVSDTGPGIPAVDQARIFEAFRRGSRPEPADKPGFGLGLAIVKQLTEMMGGQVQLDSEPGAGSTFTITLPLVAAPAQLV